jgi:uroporphyrin-3 C-methyltransferase
LGAWLLLLSWVGWQLWFKLDSMQEQLARQSADATQSATQAQTMAKRAEELSQETTARVALMELRLNEVALQRTQLDELMQSLSRSRDENLVVDIESALGLAQQQAELTGSVQPMLAALQTAQKRLGKVPQPRLAPVLRAVQHDIEVLQSAAMTDLPGLLIRLDELVAMVESLPLQNAVGSQAAPKTDKAAPETPAWPQIWQQRDWSALGQRVWAEVSGLVRVSRVTQPEAVMLSPEQSFFVRENLKLRLLNARLSVLSRQLGTARNDLAMAEREMAQFFNLGHRQGQVAKSLLKQVQSQLNQTNLPRLDASMAALATAASGR